MLHFLYKLMFTKLMSDLLIKEYKNIRNFQILLSEFSLINLANDSHAFYILFEITLLASSK